MPANRIDNAITRDGELIAAALIGNTATSRGAVLVSAGPSTSTERSRTQYAWQDIMDDNFIIQGTSIDNAITRDGEIPDALFASGTRGFQSAVAGDCFVRVAGGGTSTRTSFDWQPCPSGSGGGTLTRTIAATQPAAALTTSNIGTTQTAWQTLMDSAAITTAQAASGIDVEVHVRGASTAGSGGGDRIYALMRIVRVRGSVTTALLPAGDAIFYVRNSGQLSATANAISRRADFDMRLAVDASELAADDVIRVEVAAIAQVAGKTVTWAVADNRLRIISWSTS